MERIRVGALQYYIRPVSTFDQFRDQVEALVETAADYKCHLLAFPRILHHPAADAGQRAPPDSGTGPGSCGAGGRFTELMSDLARRHQMYIVGGTIPVKPVGTDTVYNQSMFFGPAGGIGVQQKLHMTRFESEEWIVSPGEVLRVFETAFGRVAIAICYDVEFPEIARAAAREGAHILVVPSCTDDRQGFWRVRYCAHARAIENQLYVICAGTVGSLPMVPAVSLNYHQAAILTPSDFAFSRDGILAEGNPNQEMMVIGELNLKTIVETRASGTVLPLHDSQRTAGVVARPEVVSV